MADPCRNWPYSCPDDPPLTHNPTFNLVFGILWLVALMWGTFGHAESTPEISALKGRVALAALLSPLVIQIGGCILR